MCSLKAETVLHCPLCGNVESSLFDRREQNGQVITNRLCKTCGLVYQSPRILEVELQKYYESEYRRQVQGSAEPVEKDLVIQEQRAEALVGFLHGRIPGSSRHLDIGCSSGELLFRSQQELGTHPTGIEPGSAYREFAQRRGLTVYASLEELEEAGRSPFDLVSMIHVLEHLPDPVPYLIQLRQNHMTDSSYLLLEVPNLYAHDSFEVAHLVSYSEHTLTQIVKRAGYQVLEIRKHGRPRSIILPLYITLLASPLSLSSLPHTFHLHRESAVPLKRKLGLLRRRTLQKLFPDRAWLPIPG